MTICEKVLATVRREQMIPPHTSITVGLSGGADSVALLHLLLSLREELSLDTVSAIHINHCLRNEESQRDQRFVEELCDAWGVPLTVHTCEVSKVAETERCGLEEAGRLVRYRLFEAVDGLVATAHTASDNVETVLLNLCRGSGLHGLAGILSVRGNVVRPLIDCTREEIEAYCAEYALSYVTDSTNTDIAYSRNRIRHCVLPQLKEINPQTENAITRLIARARDWDAEMSERAHALLHRAAITATEYDRAVLLAEKPLVRDAAWRYLLGESGQQRGSEQHIRAVNDVLVNGGSVSLPGHRQLTVCGERVVVSDDEAVPPFHFDNVQAGNSYVIGDTTWCVLREECEQILNSSQNDFANAIDCDRISGSVVLRQRLPADAYHPSGRGCGKTLKKLFNEASLTAAERSAVPILCDEEGIVLVAGFGCDERVRITKDTKRVLMLKKRGDS